MYTITLADGTELTGLGMNGDNFISNEEIDSSVFENNLSSVIISDGEIEETHGQMALVHLTQMDDEYWFTLRDLSVQELQEMKNRADIEYLALVLDVDV